MEWIAAAMFTNTLNNQGERQSRPVGLNSADPLCFTILQTSFRNINQMAS